MNISMRAPRHMLAAVCFSIFSLMPVIATAASWQNVRSTVAMRGLASDGSTYVAAAGNGIWTSTDLVSWTKATLPANAGRLYNDVLWDGSRFIAVGEGVIESPDGKKWTIGVKPDTTRFSVWDSIVFASAIYVVVGNDGSQVLRSTDGVHWSTETTGLSNSSSGGVYLTGVGSDGATGFVAAGYNYDYIGTAISPNSDIVLTSPDGITWTPATLPGGGGDQYDQGILQNVAFGASKYVVGGVGGVYTSPDGTTWTSVPLDLGSDFPLMNRISFMNGEFVAVGVNDGSDGEKSSVFSSSDGSTWATHKLQAQGASIFSMSALMFSGTKFLAGGYQGVYSSSDASTWTKKFAGPQTNFSACVLTGGGRTVIPGTKGSLVSSDGSSWPDSPTSTSLSANLAGKGCGAFGAGVFVTVHGTDLYWSGNGATWTPAGGMAAAGPLSGVTWTGSQFVALGILPSSEPEVLTSSDGKTWTVLGDAVVTVPSGTLQFGAGPEGAALAYLNSKLVTWGTAGGKPFVSVSSDGGTTWTTSTTGLGAAADIASVAYGDGVYVAMGNDASAGTTLFASKDAKSWTRVSGVASGILTHWNSALWGNNGFVVAGGDSATGRGAFLTSSDGKTWAYSTTNLSDQIYDVAWDGSQYTAAAFYDILSEPEAAAGGGGGGSSGGGGGSSGGGGSFGLLGLGLLAGIGAWRRRRN